MVVINLFGTAGSGKSTMAAGLFHALNRDGVKVEIVSEFAKELVWSESFGVLSDQLLVTANQNHRLHRLDGKVDYVITDSPLPIGLVYSKEYQEKFSKLNFDKFVLNLFNSYYNINYFVNRVHPYVQAGRVQNETESNKISIELKTILDKNGIIYKNIDGNDDGLELLKNEIKSLK